MNNRTEYEKAINAAWQSLTIQCEHHNLDELCEEQVRALEDPTQWPAMLDDMEARCGMDVSDARALLTAHVGLADND